MEEHQQGTADAIQVSCSSYTRVMHSSAERAPDPVSHNGARLRRAWWANSPRSRRGAVAGHLGTSEYTLVLALGRLFSFAVVIFGLEHAEALCHVLGEFSTTRSFTALLQLGARTGIMRGVGLIQNKGACRYEPLTPTREMYWNYGLGGPFLAHSLLTRNGHLRRNFQLKCPPTNNRLERNISGLDMILAVDSAVLVTLGSAYGSAHGSADTWLPRNVG